MPQSIVRQIHNQSTADASLGEKQTMGTRQTKFFGVKQHLLSHYNMTKRLVITMLCGGLLANNRKLLAQNYRFRLFCLLSAFLVGHVAAFASNNDVKLLFLGDQKGHKPSLRFRIIEPVMAERGIKLSYTEDVDKLNAQSLSKYCLLYTSPSPRDVEESRMPASA